MTTKPKHADLLIELQTEELPPKNLRALSEAFHDLLTQTLFSKQFVFSKSEQFATPRRLGVLIHELLNEQPPQSQLKRGPTRQHAFDRDGNPTKATEGFARSVGVSVDALKWMKTDQGEWLCHEQTLRGQTIDAVLEGVLQQVIAALPAPKRMRYGEEECEFVRPLHRVIALYGDKVIPITLLHCEADRVTQGHRFLASELIILQEANDYEKALEKAYVIANFAKRKARILELANTQVSDIAEKDAKLYVASEDFLDEITNLVEWPAAYIGRFQNDYLRIPKEVLLSSMQDHQRYLQVMKSKGELLPYFVVISNMESKQPDTIIAGNERVLNARLADAAFFFDQDQKETLENRLSRLKHIIYQEKLGSLYDKSTRLSALAAHIATCMYANSKDAGRAGLLAKTDLVTHMVGEFPELQGTMGYYYALHDGENETVACAIREHYQPRHASDALPKTNVAIAVALADKLDHLVGYFGIGHTPSGDKDPYGLRRAAIGVLRLLIESKQHLDLGELIHEAQSLYEEHTIDKTSKAALLTFIQERFRYYLQDRNYSADLYFATTAIGNHDYYDALLRAEALLTFKSHQAAPTLMMSQKRVQNILAKAKDAHPEHFQIDRALLQEVSEQALVDAIDTQKAIVTSHCEARRYKEALQELAKLHLILDEFFDKVMVMADDITIRHNRLSILNALRTLFLQVADLSLLQ